MIIRLFEVLTKSHLCMNQTKQPQLTIEFARGKSIPKVKQPKNGPPRMPKTLIAI